MGGNSSSAVLEFEAALHWFKINKVITTSVNIIFSEGKK